jgi:hypothetical protein
LQTLNAISAVFDPSSTEVASIVNRVAEVTAYFALVPVIEQEDPVAGAVTSIHEPELEEICAEPDFTVQATWFVLPLVTVAKIRRVEPGMTLNPYSGCATEIETEDGWTVDGGVPLTGRGVVVTGGGVVVARGGVVVTGGGVMLPEGGGVPPVGESAPLGERVPPLGGVVTGALTVIVTALDTPAA